MLLAATAASCEKSRPSAPPDGSRRAAAPDDDYADALRAANKFCTAWQMGDLSLAKKMLSPRMLAAHPEDRLTIAVAGEGNPYHVAFEIGQGQRVGEGRFSFRLRLFYRYLSRMQDRLEPADVPLVVAREGDGQWRVDEFPVP